MKSLEDAEMRASAEENGTITESGAKGCPICGCLGWTVYLEAPDRFHMRAERHVLLRCPRCSLVWLKNPPAKNDLPYHYGIEYHRTITSAGDSALKRWQRHRTILCGERSFGSLLDLGCSSGAFLEALGTDAWNLHGIEVDPGQAERARARTGAQVFAGDLLDAPFGPQSFDAITAFQVLEHVYDPVEVMRRVFFWLKPGGIFYLAVPNIACWEAAIFRSYWYGLELPRHFSHFSPASLRYLMRSVGLQEAWLTTPIGAYIELDLRYVFEHLFTSRRSTRAALGMNRGPTVVWRVARKAVRLTLWRAFGLCASISNRGPDIEAVFQKPG